MSRTQADFPPLPRGPSAPSAALTGCVVICAVALLPVLYVGSFAALVVAERLGWGVGEWLDDRTAQILGNFYWPLIWLYIVFFGIE